MSNTAGSGLFVNRHLGVDSVNSGRDDTNQMNDTKISHTVIEIGNDEPDERRHHIAQNSLAQVNYVFDSFSSIYFSFH